MLQVPSCEDPGKEQAYLWAAVALEAEGYCPPGCHFPDADEQQQQHDGHVPRSSTETAGAGDVADASSAGAAARGGTSPRIPSF